MSDKFFTFNFNNKLFKMLLQKEIDNEFKSISIYDHKPQIKNILEHEKNHDDIINSIDEYIKDYTNDILIDNKKCIDNFIDFEKK